MNIDRLAWIATPALLLATGSAFAQSPNQAPVAAATIQQLTDVGAEATVRLDGSGSSDLEEANSALKFRWIVDGYLVCLGFGNECQTVDVPLDYGTHTVVLRVTDSQNEFSEVFTNVTIDPAQLSLVEIEKFKVHFNGNDPRVKIYGNIGLPVGMNFEDVVALAEVNVAVANVGILPTTPVLFDADDNNKKWKYKNDDVVVGIKKFDVDWKGAKFDYKDDNSPIKIKSKIIAADETVLEVKVKKDELTGPVTITFNGQADAATLTIDASGNFSLTNGTIDEAKEFDKAIFSIPFPLTQASTVDLGASLSGSIAVADHYKESVGTFKLELRFDDNAFPGRAAASPVTLDLGVAVGTQFFAGNESLGALDIEVKLDKDEWKERKE